MGGQFFFLLKLRSRPCSNFALVASECWIFESIFLFCGFSPVLRSLLILQLESHLCRHQVIQFLHSFLIQFLLPSYVRNLG